jgi:hypothetical protein
MNSEVIIILHIIKIYLAGKLNALEEWRLNRSDLMTKFEKQEKNMIEQEIHHKKILYKTEKKFIIDKAR